MLEEKNKNKQLKERIGQHNYHDITQVKRGGGGEGV